MKKVSVVVPCYCMKDEYMERLMHSMETQTLGMESLELIFVIDASPDDTFERLKRYEEKYPDSMLLVNSAQKIGPGGARSLGIQYAAGKYVAFLDQDDWVESCMYEHLYEKAVQYDCDVAESYNTRDKSYVWHEGEPKRTGAADRMLVFHSAADRKAYFANGEPERRKYWAKLYKRTFLVENELDFPQKLKYDDNYFKGMVFYHAKRIYVLEEYLYHWMVNGESISMQNDFEAHFDRMRVELLKLEEYERRGLLPVYHDEMEYIFLEQFYANTFNTICTRNGTVPMEIFAYMRQKVRECFPDYRSNPYIGTRCPVWAMGEWIENALRGIAQVRGKEVAVSAGILKKLAPLSFLELLETELTQEELNWYCSIYNAFDKVAGRIDYGKLEQAVMETAPEVPAGSGISPEEAPGGVWLWLHDGTEQTLSREEAAYLGLGDEKKVVCIPAEEIWTEGMGTTGTGTATAGPGLTELLLDERYTENGLLVERGLLAAVGGKNRLLPAKWEYELALRAAEETPVTVLHREVLEAAGVIQHSGKEAGIIRHSGETAGTGAETPDTAAEAGFCTDAYVLGRYTGLLKERGLFDAVLEAVLAECGGCSDRQGAEQLLEEMLAHTGRYHKLYEATQPVLIYLGPTYCYNILNVFARELGAALERKGQRVEYYDTQKEDVQGLVKLAGKRYKASIGFQTWLMSVGRADGTGNLQDFIGGPKYNFIVDHPIWLDGQLGKVPKRFYALTHDRNYQTFIGRYYPGVGGTFLLPPGGRAEFVELGQKAKERRYDITFLGTYGDYRKKLAVIRACVPTVRFLAARYLLFMTKQPQLTAEAAFEKALAYYGIRMEQKRFLELFGEMKPVIQCVMYYYREKVVKTLLRAELEVHVYGDSWKGAPFCDCPFLKVHPEIQSEDAGAVLGTSKLSLNVMAWHKDGFTERIADSMLAGAVVVSDRSAQLEEQWTDALVLYDLDKLQELPGKVKQLLEEPERREQLAERAKEKALRLASWDVRAGQLLRLIEEENGE